MLCFIVPTEGSSSHILVQAYGQSKFVADRSEWVWPLRENLSAVLLSVGLDHGLVHEILTRRRPLKKAVFAVDFTGLDKPFEASEKDGEWKKDIRLLKNGCALVPISCLPEEMRTDARDAVTIADQLIHEARSLAADWARRKAKAKAEARAKAKAEARAKAKAEARAKAKAEAKSKSEEVLTEPTAVATKPTARKQLQVA